MRQTARSKPRAPQSDSPAAALLAWYDRHRRDLPWRAPPGASTDPYLVWLSEIMLQQTTVTAVKPYFDAFRRRWPDVAALTAAPVEAVMQQWAGLGYYARARNLHACAKAVAAQHGGQFPRTEAELRTLPGIGAYTAAAIAAIAFGEPAGRCRWQYRARGRPASRDRHTAAGGEAAHQDSRGRTAFA